MVDATKNVWPDRLNIRDTQLHDDLGGAGQRIYTTAGQGYQKREYIRNDLYEEAARLSHQFRNERDSALLKLSRVRLICDGAINAHDQSTESDAVIAFAEGIKEALK